MPAYSSDDFDPPAPVTLVDLRAPATGESMSGVPMLIDTGADVTLVPQSAVSQLGLRTAGGARYALAGFGGGTKLIEAVRLELVFCHKTFRGQFLPVDQAWGILGRNVLNAIPLLLNGPALTWDEYHPVRAP